MTTPKPASAPPADALQEVVGYLTSRGQFYGSLRAMPQAEHATARPLTIAASAQVREAEACPDCNDTGSVHRADGEYVGECKWHDKPAAEPASATINSSEIDSKLIGEPAPVAQGIERFDMDPCDYDMVRRPKGKYVLFADHARRDDELQYRLDTANAFGEQCMTDIDRLLKEAEALEASLAACRAESFADRVLSEFHDRTAEIGEVWPPEAHRQRRVGAMHKAISAAIDALRQEAP